jgi:hypothetical protein
LKRGGPRRQAHAPPDDQHGSRRAQLQRRSVPSPSRSTTTSDAVARVLGQQGLVVVELPLHRLAGDGHQAVAVVQAGALGGAVGLHVGQRHGRASGPPFTSRPVTTPLRGAGS